MLGQLVQRVVAATTADDLKSQIDAGDVDIERLAEYTDEKRRSVLHLVADHGHAGVLRYLMESLRCDQLVNAQDEQGLTPVDVALKRGQIDVIDVMLEHGANPQGIIDGEVFIVHSSVSGNVEVVQSLLKAGADPNSYTKDGLPILFFLSAMVAMKAQSDKTIAQKYEEIVKVLLQAGASPNAAGPGGFTPLHVAGEIGNLPLIMSLLEHGASLEMKNIEQKTPADVAAEWGHVDATRYLLYGLEAESMDPVVVQAEVDRLIGEKKEVQETTMKAINSGEAAPRKNLIPGPEEPSEEKYHEFRTQGNTAFVSGDFDRALDLYQQGLRHKTTDSTLWSNAAAAAIRLERYDQAMQLARIARTVDDKNVKAWYREGKAAESLQLWEDAATAYYEAFLVNNESPTKMSDVDFAELVKSAVQKGREGYTLKAKQNKK